MDRLKNAFVAAGTLGVAAAIAFVALVFIGGALAVAGVIIAAMILAGGIMSLFGKKPYRPFAKSEADDPLTVVFTRIEEKDRDPRQ